MTDSATATATATTLRGGSFLTFMLGDEEYGVEITKVREIIGMLPITPVPASPPVMDGVINLRGKVIPVINMRRRFNLMPAEPHPHNVILVVEGGTDGVIGLSVDRVKEVASFSPADVEPPPSYGMTVDGNFVAALGKSQGRIRILLDIARVLSGL